MVDGAWLAAHPDQGISIEGVTVGVIMRLINRIVSALARRKVQRDENPQGR